MLRLSDDILSRLLAEDVPHGDITTHGLGIGAQPGRMTFAARAPMVLCCVEEAARMVVLAGGSAETHARSGDWLEPGSAILTAHGPAEALLAAWKVAQTLVEATAGIATATRRLVDAAAAAGGAAVACTRKTFPGAKAPSLKAVLAGGGVPHRLGLSDSLLIFPEHRVFLDSDLAGHIARLKAVSPEKKVVAEAASLEDALQLAQDGVDVLQLEKFSPDAVAEVARHLAALAHPPVLAVAGGINADNAAAYVRAGARVLVTSSPYWAKPADVQVRIYST
jgi:molybdenum transport protein